VYKLDVTKTVRLFEILKTPKGNGFFSYKMIPLCYCNTKAKHIKEREMKSKFSDGGYYSRGAHFNCPLPFSKQCQVREHYEKLNEVFSRKLIQQDKLYVQPYIFCSIHANEPVDLFLRERDNTYQYIARCMQCDDKTGVLWGNGPQFAVDCSAVWKKCQETVKL
jgi:hypothetical protein